MSPPSLPAPEVTTLSRHGFWLSLEGRELFLPFEEFPWFKAAPVAAIVNVERPHAHHFHWPDLDVDLSVDSIEHPGRYPLKSRGEVLIRSSRLGGSTTRRPA